MVFDFGINEPLEEASTADISMDLYYSENDISYITVSGS
jgi:hypothetical protein